MRYALAAAAGAALTIFARHAHQQIKLARWERRAWNMYRRP